MGTWQLIYHDDDGAYPYFIVTETNCYFVNYPSTSNVEEEYSYTYDSKTQIMTVTEYWENESWTMKWLILKLTESELWLKIVDYEGDEGEIFEYRRLK